MKSAALYIRVSSDKQAQEGDSIPAQLDALRKYAADHHMRIYREYIDDGISGTKYSQRDELQNLLADLEHIDIILFTKLDRWFRSVRHYTATQEILDRHGVAWLAIWEPIYDTSTPQGRLIVNQMMSIAQFEAENTGQRIRAVFEYKASQGEALSGNQPYGYSVVNKRVVPNMDAPHAVDIFRHYAKTSNLFDTARYAARYEDAPHTMSAMKTMLRNTKYIGLFRDNPHYCEPLIDRALFEDVQRKLSVNIKKSQKHTYIFSGLVVCADCGAHMGVNRRIKRNYEEITYRCPAHFQPRKDKCKNAKTLNQNVLERHLLKTIQSDLNRRIEGYRIKQKSADDTEKQRKKIEKKMERLKDLYIDGMIDMQEYKADRQRLESELAQIRTEPKQDFTELENLLKLTMGEIYGTFSAEEKRRFWRELVKEIRFGSDKKIFVVYACDK